MTSLLPLAMLGLLMAVSMWIGVVANRATQKGGFLRGYFLGNRGLGSWSMALTATVMSGGTFMGFPSLVYKYGWVVALWICGYMVVPLCTFAVLGKRMGQLSRLTGAITVPEFLRHRFDSPALGVAGSSLLIFILCFNLVAQFKAGAIVLQMLLRDLPGLGAAAPLIADKSPAFIAGLITFAVVVIAYTMYGGFLAAVWTDLFQSILMAVGVLLLFPLALIASGGLEAGTAAGIAQAGEGFAFAPGAGREFLPLGLVFSYFCLWTLAGMGQPATLVRLMAFQNTRTLRHAAFLLAIYNTAIYLPLIFICICARQILPGLEKSDEVIPALALKVAHPLVAGLVLAAPFGAVLATISAFLVQISSALVQDVFHRLRPDAPEGTLKRLSHAGILLIGLFAAGATVWSPEFLQAIVVFAGGAAACAYLVPAMMAVFWPRATARGALAAMLGGFGTVLLLYAAGWILKAANPHWDPGIDQESRFQSIFPLQLTPFVWGMAVSAALGILVSLTDRPPDRTLRDRFFPPADRKG